MTQEEKQLLFKDLSSRIPYRPFIELNPGFYNKPSVHRLTGVDELCEVYLNIDSEPYNIEYIKPYLRPMSSMTEEEQQEYYDLTHQEEDDVWAKCLFDKIVDFCNERHLDYRGLIEKGLALEAPEDMYKTE